MAASAMSAALRYLKIRPRSIAELRNKLKLKGFDIEEIDAVITRCINMQLLNDRVFADAWIRYRLARPFGFGRIIRELKEKGVDADTITEAVENAKGEYAEKDVVLELATRKAARMQGLPIEKRNRRIVDFLIRRGFKADAALKVIKQLGTDDAKY